MKELLKHPFVLAAIAFFIVLIGTISVLTGIGREQITVDTGAGKIIEKTAGDVEEILK